MTYMAGVCVVGPLGGLLGHGVASMIGGVALVGPLGGLLGHGVVSTIGGATSSPPPPLGEGSSSALVPSHRRCSPRRFSHVVVEG